MAEETINQPLAQVANAVQPTQPTLVVDSKTYILKDADIYGKMMPLSENARDYNSEKMAGEQFYLYKFKGAAITVSPAFHKAFQNFELVEVTITGTLGQRTVTDPNHPAGKKLVDSQAYTVDGIITTSMQIKMLGLEKSKKELERAKKTISKIDVSKELSDDEFKELMAEA